MYRPISMPSVLERVLGKVFGMWLTFSLERHNLLARFLAGFSLSISTETAVDTLPNDVSNSNITCEKQQCRCRADIRDRRAACATPADAFCRHALCKYSRYPAHFAYAVVLFVVYNANALCRMCCVHCVGDVYHPGLLLQLFRASVPLADAAQITQQTSSTLCIVTYFNFVRPVCNVSFYWSRIEASRLHPTGIVQVQLFIDCRMFHVLGTHHLYVMSLSVSHRDTSAVFPICIRPPSVLLKVILKHNLSFSFCAKNTELYFFFHPSRTRAAIAELDHHLGDIDVRTAANAFNGAAIKLRNSFICRLRSIAYT